MAAPSTAFLTEIPAPPDFNPVGKAITKSADSEITAALRLFAGMPPSTGVFANPVRYRHTTSCNETSLTLNIRSFAIRGCLVEEDIVSGSVDAIRTIFVGIFGRFPSTRESRSFSRLLWQTFCAVVQNILPPLAQFMKAYPNATPQIAMQYMAAIRKASELDQRVGPA